LPAFSSVPCGAGQSWAPARRFETLA
jgi:hypothetical protein